MRVEKISELKGGTLLFGSYSVYLYKLLVSTLAFTLAEISLWEGEAGISN